MNVSPVLNRPWSGYVAALALTAIITGIVALIRMTVDVSNVSMLYLLAVLASAVLFGSGPAITASFAAFFAFNFFFVVPRYRFTVSEEEEWVALGLLLVTGIITGQLAAALRERARQAERREREAVVLYDVARLVAEPELEKALASVAERLRTELRLAAVVIVFDPASGVTAKAEVGDEDALEVAWGGHLAPLSILGRGERP